MALATKTYFYFLIVYMKIMKAFKLVLLLLIAQISFADEGMWLPHLLQQLNEKKMKSLGMKINASDIYSVNKGSLKDAIVSFGGFCTGEVISDKGLVLTNHHCGFDAIQNHTSIERNYIRDGFWAKTHGEELPNPGLYVTFIVEINDVTARVLNGIAKDLAESERLMSSGRPLKKKAIRKYWCGRFMRAISITCSIPKLLRIYVW